MSLARRSTTTLLWAVLGCYAAAGPPCMHAQDVQPDLPTFGSTRTPVEAVAAPATPLVNDTTPQIAETADLPSAPEPNGQAAQSSSTPGQSGSQNSNQTGSQTNPAEPSLSDLGFTQQQTSANPQMQAMLEKRTHMLKVHQTLGLITAIPMFATLVTGPQAKAKGRNGQIITEPTPINLDVHIALGGLTTGLYYTTAYYALFAPKIPGVKPQGAIRIHRDLEYIHGPGMILTPILGIMAYNQENSGQKVSGIASLHGPVAYITAIAYGASIISISWPIHWKFWEKR